MTEEIINESVETNDTNEEVSFNPYRVKKQMKTMGWGLFALIMGAQLLAIIPLLLMNLLINNGLDPILGQWLSTDLAIYGISLPIFYLIIKNLQTYTPVKSEEKWSIKRWLTIIVITFAAMYACNILANLIIAGLNAIFGISTEDVIGQNINSTASIYTFIFVVIIAPIGEEFIFRKLIIDRTLVFGERFAILYSALAFGMFHANIAQTLYATAIGLVLGYVYVKSGKLVYSIILHLIINLLGSFLVPLLSSTPVGNIIVLGFIVVMIIVGLITFIKVRKNIHLDEGELPLAWKEKCKIGFLTPGFIIYAILVLALIIYVYAASVLA